MELYYAVLINLNDCIENVILTAGLWILCKGYFRSRKQTGAVCLVYGVTMALLYYLPVYLGFMWSDVLGCLSAFLVMVFWKDEKGKITVEDISVKVYFVVTFLALSYLSINIAVRIDTMLYDKIAARMANPAYATAWAFYVLDCFTSLVGSLVKCLIIQAAFMLARALYGKDGGIKGGNFGWRETAVLVIPSVAGIVSNFVRKEYDALFISKTGQSSYALSNTVEILWVLDYLVLAAGIVIELHLFQQVRMRQEDEKSRLLLQDQMYHMQSHIAEVERIYAGIRGVHHDYASHLHILGSLLEQEEYARAKQYLITLQDSVKNYDFSIKTGNPITDVIINEKCREAEQKGISFQSDFYFGWENEINAFDVSILLNNILDNAFEAADTSQNAFVTLHSYRRKNVWMITSVNSFDGELKCGNDGFPISSKEDASIHGLGLRNVKTVVEKYFGTFSIEQKENEIALTIMLLLKEKEEKNFHEFNKYAKK